MKRLIPIVVWTIFCSVNYQTELHPVWGVRVSIGANSQLLTFVGIVDNGRTLTHQRVMDRETFIKMVSGYWPSEYNPQRINYFELNNVDCGVIKDSITRKDSCYCVPFDSLWKIRFATYPYRDGPLEEGWTRVLHKPSLQQESYLYQRYGVRVDGDFFRDTSFWMILHDVMDTAWIANYKRLK